MNSTEPDEFYSTEPLAGKARPDVAWNLAKPHIVYADYLFRRVCGSHSFSGLIDTILSGRVQHKIFSEQSSIATRVALCAPFFTVLDANRDMAPEAMRNREHDVVHWLLLGKLETTCCDDIFKMTFLFGFFPFFYQHSPVMRSDPTFRKNYSDIEPHARALDYSRRITFRYYVWKWRRFLPSRWQEI